MALNLSKGHMISRKQNLCGYYLAQFQTDQDEI